MLFQIRQLVALFPLKLQIRFLGLLALFALVACIEVVGLAGVVTFVTYSLHPESADILPPVAWFFKLCSLTETKQRVLAFGLLLLAFYLFRFFVYFLHLYARQRASQMTLHYIMSGVFRRFCQMEYGDFCERNTAMITKIIASEPNHISISVNAFLQLMSELCILFFLGLFLFLKNWQIATGVGLFALASFGITQWVLSKKIRLLGVERNQLMVGVHKHIAEMLRNFKFMKVSGTENLKAKSFAQHSLNFCKTFLRYLVMTGLPRYIIESIFLTGIVALVLFTFFMSSTPTQSLELIGFYMAALFRALPSLNVILEGTNSLNYYRDSVSIIHKEFLRPNLTTNNKVISFNQSFELRDFSFERGEKKLFSKLQLKVQRGEKIALIGESGAGKSTLVDLVMGLITPTCGKLFVDELELSKEHLASWRKHIGYIPQDIFLFDASVEENITFGRPLDPKALNEAAKKAHLEFLDSREGLKTIVGDAGVQLSGGQAQRIAIARALYGNPELLILDEATSALDIETEQHILDQLLNENPDKSLILITHRLGKLKACDKVYQIQNGELHLLNEHEVQALNSAAAK